MRIQRRGRSKRLVFRAAGPKGDPIPTRFEVSEDEFIAAATTATGLSASDVVRRSVRLAKRQTELLGGNYQFMLDLGA